MLLGNVSERLSFVTFAKVSIWRLPGQFRVVLLGVWLASGVVGNMLEVGHVFVLWNGIVGVLEFKPSLRHSIALDSKCEAAAAFYLCPLRDYFSLDLGLAERLSHPLIFSAALNLGIL